MTEPWEHEESPLQMALLALLVGLVGGYGAVLFRAMIGWIHNVSFLGILSFRYDANVHTPASPLGMWVILVPVVGALLVAFLVKNFAPEAKGHGVPEVMDAIYFNKGIIRPAVAAVKALASAISIGTGGSVGREGPIIQIGASFGSSLGQLIHMLEGQRITLIACGAGAGIAATFNTPIGGLLFATELILPVVGPHTLIPVVLSTGTATLIGRTYFGDHPAFDLPPLALSAAHVTSLWAMAIYMLFGLLLGLVSAAFIRAIYAAEDLFERLPGNYYSRHVLGMALVGVTLYLLMRHTGHYYIQGVGYSTVQDILNRVLADPWFLLLLFALKLLATCLTLGSGASGGVFSPSLYLGATLGCAYALLLARVLPDGLHVDPVSMAVVGMAGIVGGATGAAVTAVVMIFEMTRDYNVVIPVLITVSLAYGTRRLLMRNSIYTTKLIRRSHYIPESLQTNRLLLRSAADAIVTPMVCLQQPDWDQYADRVAKRMRPRPHVVLLDGDTVEGVVVRASSQRRGRRDSGEVSAQGSRFIVADAQEMLLDLIARMRGSDVDVAVVTSNGTLETADDIIGIIDWGDIAHASQLPLQILLRKSRAEGAPS